ncbi:hypothetical protein OHC33_004189 [Knufia fluminis]|uniref:Uncharacterized protein n=1 Tax=Knufia fluminis TaxID=191047 RepID=A0AAN8I4S3_9EURO|nr:hypothetical protein OHC33_004189 [Knufia fluminis]
MKQEDYRLLLERRRNEQRQTLNQFADGLSQPTDPQIQSAHLRPFHLPQLPQTQSKFMVKLGGVPEIRLQIFRNLMVDNRLSDDNYSNFCPYVLRVCQSWYREAADMLYHENTIVVDVTLRWASRLHEIKLLGEQCWVTWAGSSDATYGMRPEFPQGLVRYSEKILLRLNDKIDWASYQAQSAFYYPILATLSIASTFNEQLRAFRLLRCRSADFKGFPGTAGSALETTLAVNKRVMTSKTPPVDTLMELAATNAYLEDIRKRFFPSSATSAARDFSRKVRDMACLAQKWDVKGFRSAARELIEFGKEKEEHLAKLRQHAEGVMLSPRT